MSVIVSRDAVSAGRRSQHPVAIWLFVIAAMVFVMILVGGLTRLTGSGLSMVTWKPITGWLPPLSESDWQALFEQYKRFPEFQKKYPGMELAGFKGIFWLEYIHRVLGRVIGLAFLLPFLWFLATRRLTARMAVPLFIVFLLGAAQGALGWWMVQSGLVNEPEVSQYRLAAHLGLAVVLYLVLVWLALGLLQARGPVQVGRGRQAAALFALAVVCVTLLSGAFVAGLDAGLVYNSFPLMGGQWIPSDYSSAQPFFVNMFENPVAAQFHHRVLAVLSTVVVAGVWLAYQRKGVPRVARGAATVVGLAVVLQVFLGIETLLRAVPVSLGALHQAGAIILLTALLWLLHTGHAPRPDLSGRSVT